MRDTPTKSASILMGTRFSPRNSGSYRNRRSARTISASLRRPGAGGKAWRWLRTARGVALPPSDGARSYTQNNGELADGEVGELGRPIRERTVASSNRSEAIKFTSSADRDGVQLPQQQSLGRFGPAPRAVGGSRFDWNLRPERWRRARHRRTLHRSPPRSHLPGN